MFQGYYSLKTRYVKLCFVMNDLVQNGFLKIVFKKDLYCILYWWYGNKLCECAVIFLFEFPDRKQSKRKELNGNDLPFSDVYCYNENVN
jgi:hypothetical protein